VVLYGPQIYGQWLTAIRLEQVNPQISNASMAGLLVRLGAPQWLGLGVAGAILIALCLWAWLRRGSVWTISGGALVGLLLGSPIAWVGYTDFLLPLFAKARRSMAIVIAAALLCIPRLLLQEWADAAPLLRLTIGSAYTVAWLLLAYDFQLRHLGLHERPADTH
jgi:hypothetical protein